MSFNSPFMLKVCGGLGSGVKVMLPTRWWLHMSMCVGNLMKTSSRFWWNFGIDYKENNLCSTCGKINLNVIPYLKSLIYTFSWLITQHYHIIMQQPALLTDCHQLICLETLQLGVSTVCYILFFIMLVEGTLWCNCTDTQPGLNYSCAVIPQYNKNILFSQMDTHH